MKKKTRSEVIPFAVGVLAILGYVWWRARQETFGEPAPRPTRQPTIGYGGPRVASIDDGWPILTPGSASDPVPQESLEASLPEPMDLIPVDPYPIDPYPVPEPIAPYSAEGFADMQPWEIRLLPTPEPVAPTYREPLLPAPSTSQPHYTPPLIAAPPPAPSIESGPRNAAQYPVRR